jgi:hypothetical protein
MVDSGYWLTALHIEEANLLHPAKLDNSSESANLTTRKLEKS